MYLSNQNIPNYKTVTLERLLIDKLMNFHSTITKISNV